MHNFTSATSWAAVVSATILIAATCFAPTHQPTTLRPFPTEQASARPLATDSVKARLWQDPIEMGWKHIKARSSATDGQQSNHPEDLWSEWIKAPKRFLSQIHTSAAKTIYYLPIVLSGNPYPESRERRLRSRYAVQEVMATLQYRPRNFDKLMHFPAPINLETGEICAPDCRDHACRQKTPFPPPTTQTTETFCDADCPDQFSPEKSADCLVQSTFIPVTYEIFEYVGKNKDEPNQNVVVLWIDDLIINSGKFPNYRNSEFLTSYISNCTAEKQQIVTLSGSDELLKLLKSAEACKNETDCIILPHDPKMRINYVMSSAPVSDIIQEVGPDSLNSIIAGRIVRTTPSDNYVLAAIIDELQRRIPGFGQGEGEVSHTPEKSFVDNNQEVWLLSEQDTFYSQVMKDAFRGILDNRNLKVRVKRIGFLKGIDGNLPNDPADSKVETTESIDTLIDFIQILSRIGVPKQRLFDRRQVDYLQRLAEKLFHEQRKKSFPARVKAIGVLGGDVYDKMLALDVFRAYFPATHYFTTDLDSAYLYGPNAVAARNLIIGSAYNLSPFRLEPKSQNARSSSLYEPLVDFRDSYQTALYYSILGLLIPPNEQCDFREAFNDSSHIGLFEVGRTRFHELLKDRRSRYGERYSWPCSDRIWADRGTNINISIDKEPANEDAEGKRAKDADCTSVPAPFAKVFCKDEMPFSMPTWIGPFWLVITVPPFAAAILAMAWGLVRYAEKRDLLPQQLEPSSLRLIWAVLKNAFCKNSNPSTPTSTQFFLWALGMLGGVILVVLLFFVPAWVIRYFPILEPMYWVEGISAWPSILLRFSIFFIGFWMLTSSFAMSEISVSQLRAKLVGRKILGAHLDRFGATRVRDLAWIELLTIALLVIMHFTMRYAQEYSEGFFTPGRGWWVFFGHHMSLILSLATLLVLVWWAAFRHYRCRTFLVGLDEELLKSRGAAETSSSASSNEATSLSADEINALEGYAGVCSVTLLPPFAMMVLMVVSRHTLFDGWNIPLVLILVLGIMLFILLVSAFQLASAAHHLKLSELNYHRIRAEPDAEKRKIAEIATVWEDAGGPFGKYKQQPVIQAILFAVAAFGISFVEPTFRFFGL